jgi:hypothetical protein
MDFFKNNPGIVGQVARVIFEYLGFIESDDMPDEDHPAYQYAYAIVDSVVRASLLIAIFIVEMKVAQFLGF